MSVGFLTSLPRFIASCGSRLALSLSSCPTPKRSAWNAGSVWAIANGEQRAARVIADASHQLFVIEGIKAFGLRSAKERIGHHTRSRTWMSVPT
jgi:hypothetical protein